MFGEQAGGRDAQQATTDPGLADLEDGAVLQPEHLGRAAGKPQTTGGERQAGRCAHVQLVPQLFAQLGDMKRDCGTRDAEVHAGFLDRTASSHGGERAQLRGGHIRTLVQFGGPRPGNAPMAEPPRTRAWASRPGVHAPGVLAHVGAQGAATYTRVSGGPRRGSSSARPADGWGSSEGSNAGQG